MISCPRCRHENAADAAFCDECGARLDAACPSCGEPNRPGAKFCRKCGQGLLQAAAAAGAGSPSKFSSPETYTPKHLAEKILTSKTALEGERKQVTVLFADLKGSMELLADRDPEDARRLLDPVLEHMMEAVHRYEGTVNQVMGDGIMALFGAPLAHEDHAVRACYAALRMQEAVKRYAEGVRRSTGLPIQIRIGLNSGDVVVRSIGSDLHMDYTAVGQTTHLAARMEQMATPGTALLAPETLALAEGFVQVNPMGPVAVKGFATPIDVYELTGASAVRSRLQASAVRGLTRFVGRDGEMAQLHRALELARRGQGQVVAVVGDPGLGKSRLYHEFTHSHRLEDVLIVEGSSVSYGRATSHLPVIDLLKGYCKVADHDAPRAIREKVTGKLLALDEGLRAILPAILALLDVPTDDAQWTGLDSQQRRQRMLDAVKRLLIRESQVQTLVVVFEDLHWIDTETQALLDGLVDSLPTARLLLLVNYRPEYGHGWGGKTYYTQVRLDALPAETASELLDALLGGDPSVEPLKPLLAARTGGNPLFLEESVRSLVETGTLAGERGARRLARAVETIQVPTTVQAILIARIDRLPPEEKQLLQAAAVIGKNVPFVLLQAVADLSDDDLRRQLTHLQTAEFLYEVSLFPDLEYTFKHALTQEVAASTILAARRRALHGRAAEALIARFPDRPGELAPMLAQHYARAEMWRPAYEYASRAANAARAAYANREALGLYGQALTAAERAELGPAERMGLHAARARVHSVLGAFEDACADFEVALTLAEAAGNIPARATFLAALGALWGGHKDYAKGLELTGEAVSTAERGGDRRVLAAAVVQTALMHLNIARTRESRRELERALALFHELADERGYAETLDVLAMVDGIEGRLRDSGERLREARRRFEALDDRAVDASLAINTGLWLAHAGERARGETLIRQGLAAAVTAEARSVAAYAHWLLADLSEVYGDYGVALAEAESSLEIARQIGHREWSAAALGVLGRLRRRCGDARGARDLHEEMLAITRALGAEIWIAEALDELGEDFLALDDTARAASLLGEAVTTAGEAVKFMVRPLIGQAGLFLRLGDAAAALATAQRVQAAAPEFRVLVADARRLEGEARAALGEPAAALSVLRQAKTEAQDMAAEAPRWRICLSLSGVLAREGQSAEAQGERAEALAAIARAAAALPEPLRGSFASAADDRRGSSAARQSG